MRTEIVKVISTHRVKIIKSSKDGYWYSNMIGNEFDVVADEDFENKWNVVDGSGVGWIDLLLDKDDTVLVCEITQGN